MGTKKTENEIKETKKAKTKKAEHERVEPPKVENKKKELKKADTEKIPPKKTNLSKSDTKKRILDVALTLFSEKGYGNVFVGQIAEGVGIKAPSLYKH